MRRGCADRYKRETRFWLFADRTRFSPRFAGKVSSMPLSGCAPSALMPPRSVESRAKGSTCRGSRAGEPRARLHVTIATSGATCCVHWRCRSPVPRFVLPRLSSHPLSNCASCSAKSAARAPRGRFPRRRNKRLCTLDIFWVFPIYGLIVLMGLCGQHTRPCATYPEPR